MNRQESQEGEKVLGNRMHRITMVLCFLWVPLCVYFAGPAMALSKYDKEMMTIKAKIAEKKQELQRAEGRKAKANDNYNEALTSELTIKAELTKRSNVLKYESKRMKAFKTWNMFVTFVGGAHSLIQKVNPGTGLSAAVNFLADRAMEAGGNAPMKAKMTKLKNALDGKSPAQEKLKKVLNYKRSEIYKRLKDEGKIPKDTYYEDYMAGKHDALLVTACNRYLQDAINEAVKETDDTLANKPWNQIIAHFKDQYKKEEEKIDDLSAKIAALDRKYKEVAFFKEAWQKDNKKKTANEQTTKEQDARKQVAAVTRLAPKAVSPTTITKGQVKGKYRTVTTTETRRPDGTLIDVIDTMTDSDGNVISTTTYKNGTGEGIATTAKCPAGYVSAGGKCVSKPKPGRCTSDAYCASGYICEKASGKCVSPLDGSYGSFTKDLSAKNDQRDQNRADQNAKGWETDKSGFSSNDLSQNIDEIQGQISKYCYRDSSCASGYHCEDGTCVKNSDTNMGATINDATIVEPSEISSETNANPSETPSPEPPGETEKTPPTGSTAPPPIQPPKTQTDPVLPKPESSPEAGKVVSTPSVDTSGDWIRRIEEAHSINDWQGLLKIYTELVAANTEQYQERYITKEPYLRPSRLLGKYLQEFAEKKWDWFNDDVPKYLRKILNSSGDDKALREVIRQAQREHPTVMQKMFDNQGSPFKVLSLIQEFVVKYNIPME